MEYPGAIHHIMNRGDRREAIFRDDQDRKRFISTLGEACQKTSWEVHGSEDSGAGRREFERSMEARRAQDDPQAWKDSGEGGASRAKSSGANCWNRWRASMGRHHGGVERQETAEQRVARLVAEELKRRGWDGGELKRRKKGDRAETDIAHRLRQETTVTWDWIARGLVMGASGCAANCVCSVLSGA